MRRTLFKELLQSVKEAAAIERGKMKPSRRFETTSRADTGMHAEQFKIVNVENNEELASVGS